MNLCSILIAFLLMASTCLAADVDGKWSGTLSMQGGELPVNLCCTFSGEDSTAKSVWKRMVSFCQWSDPPGFDIVPQNNKAWRY
jgi:hypothetical protein